MVPPPVRRAVVVRGVYRIAAVIAVQFLPSISRWRSERVRFYQETSTVKRTAVAMMIAVTTALLTSGAGLAQSPEDPAEGASKKPPRQVQTNEQQRELQRLEQLRRSVARELKLTDEQHLAIREHFRRHTQFVEQYEPQPVDEQDREESRQQRQVLRRQIRQARASGDAQAVEALLEQMRSLQTADPLQQATAEFRRLVADELTEDQKVQFREILSRVYRKDDATARERSRGIRILHQAVGQLDLTGDQRAAARKLVSDAMRRFVKEGDDPDTIGDIERQLREGILELLNQEQDEAFLADVQRLREEPESSRRGPFRSPAPKRRSPPLIPEDKPSDEKESDK